MQTASLAARPARPVPSHDFARLDGRAPEPRTLDRAALPPASAPSVAKAEVLTESMADWQVFMLLGSMAAGSLSLGTGALYLLSLLLS